MNTRLLTRSGRLALVAFLALAAIGAARADEADPPGRVAQLSDVEGSVSLQPAGVQDWTAATVNRPLTTGDKLWADQNSRAELDIGAAVIRLGSATGFSFLNLDDNTAQMQVTAGTVIVHVRDLQANQNYEIDTPTLALTLQQPGDYRVEVNDAGDTTVVKVSQGQAQAAGGGQSVTIGTQQMVRFTGTDTLAYNTDTLGAPDDLDSWSASRERRVEESPSRQYVADDVAGTQDLDEHGRWEETPEYGPIWAPTVVTAGWVPYRFGHWVWIAPWGWTWVDDAPWGFVPFHYGRWVVWNSAWCWVPGPRYVRPVYAPALVAWVGGPSVGVNVEFGAHVGWFPLAPREVFVPGYRVSTNYVRQVNITNTTIVNNTYITNVYQNNVTNMRYANNNVGAVTAVTQDTFTSGRRIGGHIVRLPQAALAGATVAARAPAIVPVRQSVLGLNAGRGTPRPPASLVNRPVMARTPPPRAPVPFERQLAAIQENGGRPLARSDLARLQPATPAAPVRMIAPTNQVTSARPGAPPATAPPAQTTNLADRERALQSHRLPPVPRTDSNTAPPPRGTAYTAPPAAQPAPAPQGRSDRPPSAQQSWPPVPQRNFAVDDPMHTRSRPPSTSAYQPPAEPQANGYNRPPRESYRAPAPVAAPPPAPVREVPRPPQESVPQYRPQEPRQVEARPQERAPPPPPAQHPAPPPQPPQKAEPRDSAPHADRNSRDRSQR